MKKSIAYGLMTVMLLSVIAVMSFAIDCHQVTIYHPFYKRNMPMCRVDIDDLPALMSSPLFARWTNMDHLEKYLGEQGVSLERLNKESAKVDREMLGYVSGRRGVKMLSNKGKMFDANTNARNFAQLENRAITDIDCDARDGEIEFEIKNTGMNDWFLVPQTLTEGKGSVVKELDKLQIVAKPVELFINNFRVNGEIPVYWMGRKLFFPHGETMAEACGADFLRQGRSTDCEFGPIYVRGGFLTNDYVLLTPHFSERGTFECD